MIIKKTIFCLFFVCLILNIISDIKNHKVFLFPFLFTQIFLLYFFSMFLLQGIIFLCFVLIFFLKDKDFFQNIGKADVFGLFVIFLICNQNQLFLFNFFLLFIIILFFLFKKKHIPLIGVLHVFSIFIVLNKLFNLIFLFS